MISSICRFAYAVAGKDAAWPVLPVVMAKLDTGEIVEVHKSAASIFGYDVDELIGQPLELLIPEALRGQHAEWRKDAKVPVMRLMGAGRQVYGRRKDGTLFPAHVGLTAVMALDEDIGIAFVIDLTGLVVPMVEAKP